MRMPIVECDKSGRAILWCWLLVALLFAGVAAADYPLEVIELRSRLPEDVVPILRPLAGADGTVFGARHSLFIRAAPQRLAEIRAALETIDRPAQSLLVQVRQQRSGRDSGYGLSARVDERVGDGARVIVGEGPPGAGSGVRAWSGGRRSDHGITQQVRTVDGQAAYISVGRAQPLPYRDTRIGPGGVVIREGVTYGGTRTGFYVIPRLRGEQVTVEISAAGARPDGVGSARTADVQTRVTGRVGDWLAIGSSQDTARAAERGVLDRSRVRREARTDFEIRVVPVD